MATTTVDIYNRALDRIGVSEAVRSEGDDTQERIICEREYPAARDAVLSLFPWACARKRATLAIMDEVPAFGFSRAFRLPPDFHSIVEIDGSPRREGFVLEGDRLLSNAEECRIIYISNAVGAHELSPHVAELLSLELARRIVPGLSSRGVNVSGSLLQECWASEYPRAMAAEVRNNFPRPQPNRLIEFDRPFPGVAR